MLDDAVEAEDVAQESFVRLWRQAPRWRAGEARLDTWLHRVTLNLCYDRLRYRREIATDNLPDAPDSATRADMAMMASERETSIAAAVRSLPDRQRDAILLCHFQELGNVAAAEVMGISVEALESLLSRGRRTLRARLLAEADHG